MLSLSDDIEELLLTTMFSHTYFAFITEVPIYKSVFKLTDNGYVP